MKTTVTESDFIQAFERMGRGGSFSRAGLCALFDYLESLEQDIGEELELDVIALDCEYSEFGSARDAAEEYGWEPDEDDEDTQEEAALNWLRARTQVIEVRGGGVIIQGF